MPVEKFATAETQVNTNEIRRPSQIKTAKGSVYTWLPDGRTQRYKAATQEMCEPMDLLVFVPPWEIVKDKISPNHLHMFAEIHDEDQYDQLLLQYVQLEGRTVRIIDGEAQLLKTQAEVDAADRVYLVFIDKRNPTNTFYLPVAKDAREGFYTFDASFSKNADGVEERKRHLGNKVVEITYPA